MKQVEEKLSQHKPAIIQSMKDEIEVKVQEVVKKQLAEVQSLAARVYNAATTPGDILAPVPVTEGAAAGTVPANLPTTVFELKQLGDNEARAALIAYGVHIDPNDRPRKKLAVTLGAPYTEQ